MKKITKHDVKVFLLGMLAFFILESLYNWEQTKTDFIEGFKLGWQATEIK
jgi:hypothetical protein